MSSQAWAIYYYFWATLLEVDGPHSRLTASRLGLRTSKALEILLDVQYIWLFEITSNRSIGGSWLNIHTVCLHLAVCYIQWLQKCFAALKSQCMAYSCDGIETTRYVEDLPFYCFLSGVAETLVWGCDGSCKSTGTIKTKVSGFVCKVARYPIFILYICTVTCKVIVHKKGNQHNHLNATTVHNATF